MNLGQDLLSTKLKKTCSTTGRNTPSSSEIFTEEQLGEIPVGYFSAQLRNRGGSTFKAVSDWLVFKTSADIAFTKVQNLCLRKSLSNKRNNK